MFKNNSLSAPAYESVFIREALLKEGLRIDGRSLQEFRAININLSRTETSSVCEVQWGETMVAASASGEISSPFPDRPQEGFLLFSTNMSETRALTHSEVTRYLEKTIRNSDAIDLESLCIVGGEKVWQVKCQVQVLDTTGGNILDAVMLAVMGALKAFRRPDVSVLSVPVGAVMSSKLLLHHSDDREPLPLALQHTPLTLTFGIFKRVNIVSNLNSTVEKSTAVNQEKFVFILDPCQAEEESMDGKITFSMNAYKELCSILKPGGVSLPTDSIITASALCTMHITSLHSLLNAALGTLEQQVLRQREARQIALRKHAELTRCLQGLEISEMDLETPESAFQLPGVDRNDPILQFNNLHQAATIRE